MADPVTLQVLDAIKTRLDTISTVGGFNTDPTVYLGVRDINRDQMSVPVIQLYDTDDEPDEETAYGDDPCHSNMRIIVEGIIEDDSSQGLDLAHLLFQDIYNSALDVTDRTLGGLSLDFGYAGRSIRYPENGGGKYAVRVEFTALIQMPYGNI